MIQAWFNERGFKVVSEKGDGRFIYDLPESVMIDASQLYTFRWVVLNHLLDTINELRETIEDKDLVLYSDSRLIEELRGDLSPDNTFAQSSLAYFIQHDYLDFAKIAFEKCAAPTINEKLSERPATT